MAASKRLCIFCGAHAGNAPRYARLAAEAARTAVQRHWAIVYGGGRVGLMGVVADCALAAGGEVIGVIPRALASGEVVHDGLSQLHLVETMHERKALMAQLSDAFIALPGGFGTMDELHEVLTWRQLGIHDKPIGLLNSGGYYDELLRLYDRMMREGFVATRTRGLLVDAADIAALLQAMEP